MICFLFFLFFFLLFIVTLLDQSVTSVVSSAANLPPELHFLYLVMLVWTAAVKYCQADFGAVSEMHVFKGYDICMHIQRGFNDHQIVY